MRKNHPSVFIMLALLVLLFQPAGPVGASEALRYSSSAQVRDVLLDDGLNRFSQESGIALDLFVGSSEAAVQRLVNSASDIASSAEPLSKSMADYGFIETPFCKVPLIAITNVQTTVRDISEEQLRKIFLGQITNWKELGGPDQKIVVIIPAKDTAAFKNFSRLAMASSDVVFDYLAYRSTMTVMLVHRVPWSISFIAKGMATRDAAIKIMKVNGKKYTEADYPYFETFSFVTKGEPAGSAKALIDFAASDNFKTELRSVGIVPLLE